MRRNAQARFGSALCWTIFLLGLLNLSFGCKTVQTANVTKFGQSVATARQQTETAFTQINQLITDDEIARALTLDQIQESDVITVIKTENIEQWEAAFNEIDKYVANLQELLSPDLPKGFTDSLGTFGEELKKVGGVKALPSADVSAGFAEVGKLLIEAKAQSDAKSIALHVDPGMQKLLRAMFDAIGTNDKSDRGLRRLVWIHWSDRLDRQAKVFQKAQGADAKKQALLDYISLRDQRDAQDLALSSLSNSYLQLGAAHSALAQGSDVNLAAALSFIQQELKTTRDLFNQFSAMKKKEATTNG